MKLNKESYETFKPCEYCGEDVPAFEFRCKYCGSLLDRDIYYASATQSTQSTQGTQGTQGTQDVQPVQNPIAYPEKTNDQRDDRKVDQRDNLSNGIKVMLTVIFTLIPFIGQLTGIITSIVFMNYEDKDRKSFGLALLIASLVMFVISCIFFLVIIAVIMQLRLEGIY